MKVLIIDNYDSFTYNLVQYLGELGATIEVVRNDRRRSMQLLARKPDRVVVSPGPCTPNEAGVSMEAIERFAEAGVPVLGVCLGHQALGQVFGGEVIRERPDPRQDRAGRARRQDDLRRHRIPDRSRALPLARREAETACPTSSKSVRPRRPEGEIIMALRHKELPAEGVQFHPESILTGTGLSLLANFLKWTLADR